MGLNHGLKWCFDDEVAKVGIDGRWKTLLRKPNVGSLQIVLYFSWMGHKDVLQRNLMGY